MGRCNMREGFKLGTRVIGLLVLLGALWPWLVPFYSQAAANLADALLVALRAPFGVQAISEGIELSWQPLRYTTFRQLQEQMGYVDRFARRGLQGHRLATMKPLYLQSEIILAAVLLWACPALSLTGRLQRTPLLLGALLVGQALYLAASTVVEFELHSRTMSTAQVFVTLQDHAWYLYYGLSMLLVVVHYLLPWLIGGGLTYKFWKQVLAQRPLAPGRSSEVAL